MRQFERKVTLKNLEISETLAQVADRIKDPYGIPMGKKMMSLDDNEEFVAMVLSFAERKSMTISNIKDAIQEVVAYMEDNATLNTDLGDQCYSETVRINAGAEPKYYMSNEEVIECMRNAKCAIISTESTLIYDCLTKLENDSLSAKEREELLKTLPSGMRQLFSGEPIREPQCLKCYRYRKRDNQGVSSKSDSEIN